MYNSQCSRHWLCTPHRSSCASQWSEGHEGVKNHPVRFWGVSPRPLHNTARDQGQVFLHHCLLQVALQQDPGCWLWCCVVNICENTTFTSLNFTKCLLILVWFVHVKSAQNRINIPSFGCKDLWVYHYYRKCVKDTVIEKFAGPYHCGEYSPSVQKTLYETQVLVLDRIPEVGQSFHNTQHKYLV